MIDITVATVCLNAATTLRDTIESVAAAGDAVAQYVIVDGGSTDGTVDMINEAQPAFGDRLAWVSQPDDGLYHAMNHAIELATGAFVLFLGADDRLVDGSMQRMRDAFDGAADVGLIYGDVEVVESDGRTRIDRGCDTPKMVGSIPRAMPACHQATLFATRDLRALGGFDTSFRIAADYELYLRFLELGRATRYVPTTIARFSAEGLSTTNARATAEEYRRAWVKHGVAPATARLRMYRSLANGRAARLLRR